MKLDNIFVVLCVFFVKIINNVKTIQLGFKMKYWKEEEISLVETMDFWKGNYITKLEPNEVFVFGANPQARHFAGAAKAALGFGAVPINTKQNKPGIARGLSPNNKTYALITKSLEAGYTEPETGITYHKEGFQSVSPEQIRANIDELYETAKKPEHLDKKFLVTYQYEAWPNGTPKKSLNGYTSQEMLEMFVKDKDVPPNIVFHESYKPHLEKLYKNQNKQSNGELVVYEDGKSIDIKEENIVWTIDSDERNPQGINGAGAAKAAMSLSKGAKNGVGRGFNGANAYALVTKSLNAGFLEKSTGILYDKEGYCSVSPEQIRTNIDELYEIARSPEHKDKKFLVSYQYESWPNGTPKKSLNGYTSQEMLEMFAKDKEVPPNIVFHESYKPHLEKLYKNQNEQSNGELVVFEGDKIIDVKEEELIWTIDSDERNPEARHFAGAAKSALKFGAIPRSNKTDGIARGLSPNKQTYGIITKNLTAGITVDGILYEKEGYLSVSPEQISDNIDELYLCAKEHSDRRFLITYKYEFWPNGSPKKSLNGYTSQEMLEMFAKDKEVPPNIVFHESYKPHLEKLYQSKNKVVVSEENRTYSKPNVTNPTNNTPAKSIVGNKVAKDVKVEGNLLVVSPQDNVPEGFNIINTTSRDTEGFGKKFILYSLDIG